MEAGRASSSGNTSRLGTSALCVWPRGRNPAAEPVRLELPEPGKEIDPAAGAHERLEIHVVQASVRVVEDQPRQV